MTDVVDLAGSIEAETVARAVARAAQPIPAGVSGECDECEWWMPRLVEGRCAFCRDGRRRPDDWEPPVRPDLPPAAPAAPPFPPTETPTMGNTPGSKSITFVATGEVLAEIKRRTEDGDVTNNRAALDLIEAGMRAPVEQPTDEEVRTPRQRLVTLLDGVSDLLAEQIDAAAEPKRDEALIADRDAWKTRAEEAEARAIAAEQRAEDIKATVAKL